MPPNEELVRSYLVRKGFLLNAANVAVNSFRDTMSVVSDVEQDYAQPPEEEVDEMQNVSEEDIKLPAQPTQPGEATKENSWVAVAKQHAQNSERRLFNYDFEDEGGVSVVVHGAVDTKEALDIIDAWIVIKRRELARKAGANSPRPVKSDDVSSDRESGT